MLECSQDIKQNKEGTFKRKKESLEKSLLTLLKYEFKLCTYNSLIDFEMTTCSKHL